MFISYILKALFYGYWFRAIEWSLPLTIHGHKSHINEMAGVFMQHCAYFQVSHSKQASYIGSVWSSRERKTDRCTTLTRIPRFIFFFRSMRNEVIFIAFWNGKFVKRAVWYVARRRLITGRSNTMQDYSEKPYLMPRIDITCLIIQTKRTRRQISKSATLKKKKP